MDLQDRWGPTDIYGRAVHGVLVQPLRDDWRFPNEWGRTGIPDPPLYDPSGPGGPLAASPLERLRDLGDLQYEALLYADQLKLYRWST